VSREGATDFYPILTPTGVARGAIRGIIMSITIAENASDKGKPIGRWGHKATGPTLARSMRIATGMAGLPQTDILSVHLRTLPSRCALFLSPVSPPRYDGVVQYWKSDSSGADRLVEST